MLRPKLNRIWTSASSTRRRDPGDAKYIQGWISEIPTFQVLNYLQWKVDTTMLALAERGFFEWGTDVTYGLDSIVWDETTKKVYIATVGSPDKTKAPSTNPAHWSASSIQISRASYDAISAAITAHIADITSNPHKVTAGNVGAYNKNETDTIFAQYRALVSAHTTDYDNPHELTALGIGAVPSTGGTYSGDVTFLAGLWLDAAAETGITRDSGGLWLKNGAGRIGINAAGEGVVGTTSSQSKIVTEDSYPALKAAQEPAYAVPEPTWLMKLIRSICVYTGVGFVDANFTPVYSGGGAHIVMGSDQQDQVFTQDSVFGNTAYMSLCIDGSSDTARNPSDTQPLFIYGTDSFYFHYTGASQVVLNAVDATTGAVTSTTPYQLSGPLGATYRTAATYDGTTMKLYLNGVLIASKAVANVKPSNNLQFLVKQRTTALRRNWRLWNARVWQAVVLTDKQVSSL